MNVYKFSVEIFVRGADAKAAFDHMAEEFAYHFGQDNDLVAVAYPEGEQDAAELAEVEQ